MFIVFDGIAGSGKTTIINAVKEDLLSQGKKIFDLAEWSSSHTDPPTEKDWNDADVIFSFEPTKQWTGRAIRYEMSQEDHPYSGLELAQAFSLDRLIQYRRFILPARKAGKIIIQDRSVTSSIVYQPIMKGGPKLDDLLQLPGNKLALEHAPDVVILTKIDTHLLEERYKRDDDNKGVFQNVELLNKVQDRFHADWFKELFPEQGTEFKTIDTSQPIKTTLSTAIQYVQTYLTR